MEVNVLELRNAGYAYLVEKYSLTTMPHWHISKITASGIHRSIIKGDFIEDIYPQKYWPGDRTGDHLEFALKYDGVNLCYLKLLFDRLSQEDERGEMTVHNFTAHWYRYMDMSAQAEALYAFVGDTIEKELVEELLFLANYAKTKKSIQEIIDMRDRLIDLFIQLCLQNNGTLSAKKRETHFAFLTDTELSSMERSVRDGYGLGESLVSKLR